MKSCFGSKLFPTAAEHWKICWKIFSRRLMEIIFGINTFDFLLFFEGKVLNLSHGGAAFNVWVNYLNTNIRWLNYECHNFWDPSLFCHYPSTQNYYVKSNEGKWKHTNKHHFVTGIHNHIFLSSLSFPSFRKKNNLSSKMKPENIYFLPPVAHLFYGLFKF